jgi:hypothetical protein
MANVGCRLDQCLSGKLRYSNSSEKAARKRSGRGMGENERLASGFGVLIRNKTRPPLKSGANSQLADRFSHSLENFALANLLHTRREEHQGPRVSSRLFFYRLRSFLKQQRGAKIGYATAGLELVRSLASDRLNSLGSLDNFWRYYLPFPLSRRNMALECDRIMRSRISGLRQLPRFLAQSRPIRK